MTSADPAQSPTVLAQAILILQRLILLQLVMAKRCFN